MKLEFEQKTVPKNLRKELDFDGFLSGFDLNITLLPNRILRPMKKAEGERHFHGLRELESMIKAGKLNLESIIDRSSKLPCLDPYIPFFGDGVLEQFHLHELGNFVADDIELQKLEKNHPLPDVSGECCFVLRRILEAHMEKRFSSMRYLPVEQEMREKLRAQDEILRNLLADYEKEIRQSTGLAMTYPYPREIPRRSLDIPMVKGCKLLSVVDDGSDVIRLDYRLSIAIEEALREKESADGILNGLMNERLREINNEIMPYFEAFSSYYKARKNRTFLYILLKISQQKEYILPEFHESTSCVLDTAVLPALMSQRKDKYMPLDLRLDCGASVLFGGNMSGKTTVLKTLYFILTAIRMGLPVPARSAKLYFPEQVEIHLKSAGNIRRDISSFGDEIRFFTKKFLPHAYVLVDELFQSTNPISAPELSSLILEEFNSKDVVFFCTSQYPEVLQIKDIVLFRMKDPGAELNDTDGLTLEELLEKNPYVLERIPENRKKEALIESKRPLYVALHFPLPESIKKRIRERLKG